MITHTVDEAAQLPMKESEGIQNRVFFDIETIKTENPEIRQHFFETVKHPGTIKDPSKIDAWYGSDKHHAAADKKVRDTVFDGLFGEVVSICWGHYDEAENWHSHNATRDEETSEEDILRHFFRFLSDEIIRFPRFVGFNIIGFDMPFLTKRALVLGVNLPKPSDWPRQVRPWSDDVEDLMVRIESDRSKHPSMNAVCKALGIEGKGDIDGSMVGDLWEMGEYQMINDYCSDDKDLNRNVWLKCVDCGLICI